MSGKLIKGKLILIAWTIGILGGILFCLLRISGRVKVKGYKLKKFKPRNKGLVLISNHPSLWEPAILPFLFFPWYLVSLKAIPFSTPDKKNYYQKFWFWLFRLVCIPIERGDKRKELATLERIKEMLQEGKIIILFPEGGRTFKGTEFKFSRSGEKIRKFPAGIRKLFVDNDCFILPVWVRGGEGVIPNKPGFPGGTEFLFAFFRLYKKVEIIIGEVIDSKKLPQEKEKIVPYLEDILLELADRRA